MASRGWLHRWLFWVCVWAGVLVVSCGMAGGSAAGHAVVRPGKFWSGYILFTTSGSNVPLDSYVVQLNGQVATSVRYQFDGTGKLNGGSPTEVLQPVTFEASEHETGGSCPPGPTATIDLSRTGKFPVTVDGETLGLIDFQLLHSLGYSSPVQLQVLGLDLPLLTGSPPAADVYPAAETDSCLDGHDPGDSRSEGMAVPSLFPGLLPPLEQRGELFTADRPCPKSCYVVSSDTTFRGSLDLPLQTATGVDRVQHWEWSLTRCPDANRDGVPDVACSAPAQSSGPLPKIEPVPTSAAGWHPPAPAGQQLVFSLSQPPCPQSHCLQEIATSSLDGSEFRKLTKSHHDVRPLWSPDGKLIAFGRLDVARGLGVMNADGSDLRFLRTPPHLGYHWIDSHRLGLLNGLKLDAIDVRTGKITVVATLPWQPEQWLTDGHAIALFRTYPADCLGPCVQTCKHRKGCQIHRGRIGLWITRMNGTAARFVTLGPPIEINDTSGSENFGYPANQAGSLDLLTWSRDGSTLLVDAGASNLKDSQTGGNSDRFWLVNIHTGVMREIASPLGQSLYASFSPDDRSIIVGGAPVRPVGPEGVAVGKPSPVFLGAIIPGSGAPAAAQIVTTGFRGYCTGSDQEIQRQHCALREVDWRP